jgi:hypothetical protein
MVRRRTTERDYVIFKWGTIQYFSHLGALESYAEIYYGECVIK